MKDHHTSHPILKLPLGYGEYITQCEQYLELLTGAIQGNIDSKDACTCLWHAQLQVE